MFITTLGFGTSMSFMGKILAPPKIQDNYEIRYDDLHESSHHLIEHPNEQLDELDDTIQDQKHFF